MGGCEAKERFIMNLSEKLNKEGIYSDVAYKIARDVASEYIGQPVAPLVDYYKKKHIK
jgi:hypothetical protein